MYFMGRVILRAQQRQSRINGRGFACARCGEFLSPFGKSYPVPIIPKGRGGRATIDNCAILCPKCYLEIGKIRQENNTYTIPDTGLPFLGRQSK